jgi:hypothetical protein
MTPLGGAKTTEAGGMKHAALYFVRTPFHLYTYSFK